MRRGELQLLRVAQVAVACACIVGTAVVIDGRQDGRGTRASAGERPASTASTTPLDGATDLALTVASLDPLASVSAAGSCLAAGTGCGADLLLDVDTTRIAASELAQALRDPTSVQPMGTTTRQLVVDTVDTSTGLASDLQSWLSEGCGGSIDGIALTTSPPAACDAHSTAARDRLAQWSALMHRWMELSRSSAG